MSFNWNTVLSIVLFVVALGVLVCIHELGHFIFAKSFKVYCTDFSIGFGPKIFSIKRKNGETSFTLRVVPLGGFVAMFENCEELPEEYKAAKGRTLSDINPWKRICVYSGGIIMNFVLAYLIFFIGASCFEQKGVNYINEISVSDTALQQETLTVDKEGEIGFDLSNPILYDSSDVINVKKADYLSNYTVYYMNESNEKVSFQTINNPNDPITISNVDSSNYSLVFDSSNAGLNNLDFSEVIKVAVNEKYTGTYYISTLKTDSEGNLVYDKVDGSVTPIYLPVIKDSSYSYYELTHGEDITISPAEVMINHKDYSSSSTVLDIDTAYLHVKPSSTTDGKLEEFGFGSYIYSYWNGAKSFAVAGNRWTQSTSLISQALGGLFVGQGWDQLGGPVAIFTQTTTILNDYPAYVYLNTWGTISVNLALFNLLPFPGLDGWSIIVGAVEGIVNFTKRKKYEASKKENKNTNTSTEKTVSEDNNVVKEINVGEKKEEYKPWSFPSKIKNIMSYVGLGLIMLLMVVVFVKDIINLF
ncbi:MAG: site-2 protease family protein [Bacilli bacterium]